MSFSSELIIIYKQSTNESSVLSYGVPQGPLLTYVFGAWFKGKNITLTTLAKKYSALFGLEITKSHEFVGPFNSEEELKKFSYLLAEEIKADKANLIPISLFASSIEESKSLDDLHRKLKSCSDEMENMEIKSETTGLLQRLISKNR